MENRESGEKWEKAHRRYYRIANITIQVESDAPVEDTTFDKAVGKFEVPGPSEEMVFIRHRFSLPDIDNKDLGKQVYRKPPWAIYRKGGSWIYLGISPLEDDTSLHQIALFNNDHSRGRIFSSSGSSFERGGFNSLCLFPTDQILIARILADRAGFYLHSAGVVYHGQGLLFVGHSGTGKSTTVKMLQGKTEILCDDRIILRKETGEWTIHGTWSHGEIPDVSPGPAPLKAIFLLEKAEENRIVALEDGKEILAGLLACVIRPFADADWWKKTLSFVEDVSINVPCYRMLFDKSGGMVSLIEELIARPRKDDKKLDCG
jgi:hypothetical protein